MARNRQRLLAELSRGLQVDSEVNTINVYDEYIFQAGDNVYLGSPKDGFAAINVLDSEFDDSDRPIFGTETYGQEAIRITKNVFVDDDVELYPGVLRLFRSGSIDSDLTNKITDWDGDERALDSDQDVWIRNGERFDSDLQRMIIDSFLRRSRNGDRTPGDNRGYNTAVETLANEISVYDLYDVADNIEPLVGQTLVWNGGQWVPNTPVFGVQRHTFKHQSGEILQYSKSIGYDRIHGDNNEWVFLNGRLLARDPETIEADYDDFSIADADQDPADYTIRPNTYAVTPDVKISGTGTILSFDSDVAADIEINPFNDLALITHLNIHNVYLHKAHYHCDWSGAVLNNIPVGKDTGSSIRDRRPWDRAGELLVFQNGTLLDDADFTVTDVADTSTNVTFTADLTTEDEVQFAWIQASGDVEIDKEEITTVAGDSEYSSTLLASVDDPYDALIFYNGLLLQNNPVIEYVIDSDGTITFNEAPEGAVTMTVVASTGSDYSDAGFNLGDMDNIPRRVDTSTLHEGEALVSKGDGDWDHHYSSGVNSALPYAWAKVNESGAFEAQHGFSGVVKDSSGNFTLTLDSEIFDSTIWSSDTMGVQVTAFEDTTGCFGMGRVSGSGPFTVDVRIRSHDNTTIDPDEFTVTVHGRK